MSRLLKSLIFALSVTALSLSVLPVAAQFGRVQPDPGGDGTTCGGVPCTGTESTSDLITKIEAILSGIMTFLAIAAAAAIIYGGIKYIISLGSEDDAAKAKRIILYAIIGLIVTIMAAAIINFVLDKVFSIT